MIIMTESWATVGNRRKKNFLEESNGDHESDEQYPILDLQDEQKHQVTSFLKSVSGTNKLLQDVTPVLRVERQPN